MTGLADIEPSIRNMMNPNIQKYDKIVVYYSKINRYEELITSYIGRQDKLKFVLSVLTIRYCLTYQEHPCIDSE